MQCWQCVLTGHPACAATRLLGRAARQEAGKSPQGVQRRWHRATLALRSHGVAKAGTPAGQHPPKRRYVGQGAAEVGCRRRPCPSGDGRPASPDTPQGPLLPVCFAATCWDSGAPGCRAEEAAFRHSRRQPLRSPPARLAQRQHPPAPLPLQTAAWEVAHRGPVQRGRAEQVSLQATPAALF